MATATRTVRVGDRSIPVELPSPRDPRLHTAAVIVSVHMIGLTALGFRVSVPQILSAILTAGLVELIVTLLRTGKLVWPASGMLTGSGVALILRLVGMESGDYWSWTGWYWFAVVAAVSVLSKYLIRFRDTHLFNPSNIGLVLAFLILGSAVAEPLDFWWAPPGFWMITAYLVIVGGGVLITRRLRLLEMAVVYWLTLTVGLGVLAASGHCMIAQWSPTPVCDWRFWSVLVTSPEILVFGFFMITDPKTIPWGRSARVGFAASLGLLTVLMIAPHSLEFGAKVGLLASLALLTPLRGLFDRFLVDSEAQRSGIGEMLGRLKLAVPRTVFVRGVAMGATLVLAALAIVAAGGPAREGSVVPSVTHEKLEVTIDPSKVPEPTADNAVRRVGVDEEMARLVTQTLAENLAIEGEAIRTANGSLLGHADGGRRLDEMQARIEEAIATGERLVDEYTFDTLHLSVHRTEGEQVSLGLLVHAVGEVERVSYDPMGAEWSRESEEFSGSFVLRQLAGERWLIVDFNGET